MNDIDYEKLADEIAKKMRVLPPPEKVIWTPEQCAEYLGVSKLHFVNRVSKIYGFPAPIKLPSEGGRGHARYYAVDVQTWVSQQKKAS
jgi:predicted DNA-binding transcriptional regulator AlpA